LQKVNHIVLKEITLAESKVMLISNGDMLK
jgi:hypothetical protein